MFHLDASVKNASPSSASHLGGSRPAGVPCLATPIGPLQNHMGRRAELAKSRRILHKAAGLCGPIAVAARRRTGGLTAQRGAAHAASPDHGGQK